VAISSANQPEHDLGLQEGQPVLFSIVAACQEAEAFADAWSTIIVILAYRGHRERLAEIFLGNTEQSAITRFQAVKALHSENADAIDINNLALRHFQPEFPA